jgi:hypothetical protein
VSELPADVRSLADAVSEDGGAVLATYREPLGGHVLLLCALPIDLVAPTPFQRDVSDAHVRRLTQAMDKTKRFLDPVIAVREARVAATGDDDRKLYWIPNGYHRLTALRELGAKTLVALVVPETAVAYQILALNIEKAHNLRERALGVARMYRDLVASDAATSTRTRSRSSSRSRRSRRSASRTRSDRGSPAARTTPSSGRARRGSAGRSRLRSRSARDAHRPCSRSTTRSARSSTA